MFFCCILATITEPCYAHLDSWTEDADLFAWIQYLWCGGWIKLWMCKPFTHLVKWCASWILCQANIAHCSEVEDKVNVINTLLQMLGDLKCMSVNTCYLLVIPTFVLQMSAVRWAYWHKWNRQKDFSIASSYEKIAGWISILTLTIQNTGQTKQHTSHDMLCDPLPWVEEKYSHCITIYFDIGFPIVTTVGKFTGCSTESES
jgi:hypothetical protein